MRHVETSVSFKRLQADEIAGYLASEEWRGKAGGYAIQGRDQLIARIHQRFPPGPKPV